MSDNRIFTSSISDRTQFGYGVPFALALVAVAAAVRAPLHMLIPGRSVWIPFFVAVIVTAGYGGMRSGVLATVLSAVAGGYFFVEPFGRVAGKNIEDALEIGQFLIAGVSISWMAAQLRSARAAAESGEREAKLAQQQISNLLDEVLQSEKEIRRSLEEKELLLGEIRHRVKNNLQVVLSLLNMEAGRAKEPAVSEVCKRCRGRILSMALIHEQACQSANLGKVDFREYVECVAKEALRSSNRDPASVSVRVEANPVSLSLENAIPCGLIVNELLSNSLEHAFHDRSSGEILIRLDVEDDTCGLTVDDNGQPLPLDLATRESSTMGLRLVKALTRQLDGNLHIGGGREPKFHLTFPREREKETVS